MAVRRLAALAVALQAAACATAPAAPPCATDPAAEREATEAIRAFYAALARDDEAGLGAVVTDDFFAYEVGRRFTAAALFQVIVEAHRGGTRYEWNVADVQARTSCDLAWATWTNRGAIGRPGAAMQPAGWLESAVLEREGGRWRLRFLHSTPTPREQ